MIPNLEETDGRRARAVRTRSAIVGALLDLVREGILAPTAKEIAARAGVAIRSIGQHFPSRENLFVAAAAEHARRGRTQGREAVSTFGALDDRIERFLEARAFELEETSALRRAASVITRSPTVTKAMTRTAEERRKAIVAMFSGEIADDAITLDALEIATGGRAWDQMRVEIKLSVVVATSVMKRMLVALLRA
ncbi:TetR/AcrR family transcriptional regulator [soil metagenome]